MPRSKPKGLAARSTCSIILRHWERDGQGLKKKTPKKRRAPKGGLDSDFKLVRDSRPDACAICLVCVDMRRASSPLRLRVFRARSLFGFQALASSSAYKDFNIPKRYATVTELIHTGRCHTTSRHAEPASAPAVHTALKVTSRFRVRVDTKSAGVQCPPHSHCASMGLLIH